MKEKFTSPPRRRRAARRKVVAGAQGREALVLRAIADEQYSDGQNHQQQEYPQEEVRLPPGQHDEKSRGRRHKDHCAEGACAADQPQRQAAPDDEPLADYLGQDRPRAQGDAEAHDGEQQVQLPEGFDPRDQGEHPAHNQDAGQRHPLGAVPVGQVSGDGAEQAGYQVGHSERGGQSAAAPAEFLGHGRQKHAEGELPAGDAEDHEGAADGDPPSVEDVGPGLKPGQQPHNLLR